MLDCILSVAWAFLHQILLSRAPALCNFDTKNKNKNKPTAKRQPDSRPQPLTHTHKHLCFKTDLLNTHDFLSSSHFHLTYGDAEVQWPLRMVMWHWRQEDPMVLERQVGKAFLLPLVKLRAGRGKPVVIQKHKIFLLPSPQIIAEQFCTHIPDVYNVTQMMWSFESTHQPHDFGNIKTSFFFLKHHHRESLPQKTQNYLLSLRPLNRCAEIIYKEWPPDRDTTFILKLQRIFPVIVNFFNYCFLLKDKLYNKLWRIIIEKIIMARQ